MISQSVAHNNRGLRYLWEGPGFMTEINQGPGKVEYSLTYDNAGAGVQICETEDLTVIGNVIVNDTIEMRNLLRDDGDWKLEDLNVVGNLFKNGYVDTSQAGLRWNNDRAGRVASQHQQQRLRQRRRPAAVPLVGSQPQDDRGGPRTRLRERRPGHLVVGRRRPPVLI